MILYKYAKVPVYCTPSWCVSWKNVFAQSCHTYIIYKKVREWVDEWTELSTLHIGGSTVRVISVQLFLEKKDTTPPCMSSKTSVC